MGKFVEPKVYLIGVTSMLDGNLDEYLLATNNVDFVLTVAEARRNGLSDSEILCSIAAKICYKALTVGQNANVSRTRDIESNITQGIIKQSHLSVLEHVNANFMITDCSRILTHELCRHRAGFAFSQTSGRFCRLDSIDLVMDPILQPCEDILRDTLTKIEDAVYLMECKLGLREPPPDTNMPAEMTLRYRQDGYDDADHVRWIPSLKLPMDERKKITSAIRRIAPNGQSNEIFTTMNLRAARHTIQLRTGRHSEREIRLVFAKIFSLLLERFPLLFCDAKTREVNGITEVYGMKQQPYERTEEEVIANADTRVLADELARRQTVA